MDQTKVVLDSCQSLIATIVKFNSATVARDKLSRFLQYGAKIIGHILTTEGYDKDVIAKCKKLEVTVSTSRKTFRLGKFLDMIQGAIKGCQVSDPVIRTCIIIARLCRTIYFLYDVLNWAARVTLIQTGSKHWAQRAAPYWLIAVVFSLVRDLYELLMYNVKSSAKKKGPSFAFQVLQNRPELILDTVKNMSDLIIPLNIMGKVDVSQGVIGVLGLMSSTCGIISVASPAYKLSPM